MRRATPFWPVLLLASLAGCTVHFEGGTCVTDLDCPSELTCNPAGSTCVAHCNLACASGLVCAFHSGAAGCECPTLREPAVYVNAAQGSARDAGFRVTGAKSPVQCAFRELTEALAEASTLVPAFPAGVSVALAGGDSFTPPALPLWINNGVTLTGTGTPLPRIILNGTAGQVFTPQGTVRTGIVLLPGAGLSGLHLESVPVPASSITAVLVAGSLDGGALPNPAGLATLTGVEIHGLGDDAGTALVVANDAGAVVVDARIDGCNLGVASVSGGSVRLVGGSVEGNQKGVSIGNGQVMVEGTTFQDNAQAAIEQLGGGSVLVMDGGTVQRNGGFQLDITAGNQSQTQLRGLQVRDGSTGLRVRNSRVTLERSTITGQNAGVLAQGSSDLWLLDSNVSLNDAGVVLAGAAVSVTGGSYSSGVDFYVGGSSSLSMDGGTVFSDALMKATGSREGSYGVYLVAGDARVDITGAHFTERDCAIREDLGTLTVGLAVFDGNANGICAFNGSSTVSSSTFSNNEFGITVGSLDSPSGGSVIQNNTFTSSTGKTTQIDAYGQHPTSGSFLTPLLVISGNKITGGLEGINLTGTKDFALNAEVHDNSVTGTIHPFSLKAGNTDAVKIDRNVIYGNGGAAPPTVSDPHLGMYLELTERPATWSFRGNRMFRNIGAQLSVFATTSASVDLSGGSTSCSDSAAPPNELACYSGLNHNVGAYFSGKVTLAPTSWANATPSYLNDYETATGTTYTPANVCTAVRVCLP